MNNPVNCIILLAEWTIHLSSLDCINVVIYFRYVGKLLDDDMVQQVNVADDRRLQALAAGLKAYSSWEAVNALQACRECTGGMVRPYDWLTSLSFPL